MVHDIIPMQIRIPSRQQVEMESIMFLGSSGYDEDIYRLSRNIKGDYGSIYRYKLIEQYPGVWIERSLISFDELDLFSMRLCNPVDSVHSERLPSVDLFPITTKIHKMTSSGVEVKAYRHFNSIKAVIGRLCGTDTRNLFSVHSLFLHALATSMFHHDHLEYSNALESYAESNRARIKSVINASDEENATLISYMNSLANHEMFEIFADDHNEFLELVETWSRLPVVEPYDQFTRWMGIRPYFSSDTLRHHLSPTYGCREFSVQISTQDIFEVDRTVRYHSNINQRWDIAPLVNLLELLPYTDLSLEYGINGMHVHYAISMFGPVQEFQTMLLKNPLQSREDTDRMLFDSGTKLIDLEVILDRFIRDEGISRNPMSMEISLVKTFCEDVFLNIKCPRTNKNYRYYFDLTLFALGSKGVVDHSLFNMISSQGSPFWSRINRIRNL